MLLLRRCNVAAFFFNLNKKEMNTNFNNRFSARSGYPGQQTGNSLEQTRKDYILNQKIYGQAINLVAGINPDIDINLPKDGRQLLGISVYIGGLTPLQNPNFDLIINNTRFVQSVGLRTIFVETLQDKQYTTLNLPLSGDDQIRLTINNGVAGTTAFFNFYYV